MQTMNNRLTIAENNAANKKDWKSGWIMTVVAFAVCAPVFAMVVTRIG